MWIWWIYPLHRSGLDFCNSHFHINLGFLNKHLSLSKRCCAYYSLGFLFYICFYELNCFWDKNNNWNMKLKAFWLGIVRLIYMYARFWVIRITIFLFFPLSVHNICMCSNIYKWFYVCISYVYFPIYLKKINQFSSLC